MNFSVCSILLLLSYLTLVATKDQNVLKRKCDYRDTVDLTNQTCYENGTYVYQNVLIPPEKQDFYDYQYLFLSKKDKVPRHLRGCVCTKSKPCIKLCCEQNAFFDTDSHVCKDLTIESEVSWNLTVKMNNGSRNNVNMLDNFIYQVGVPCKMPEALIDELDKWDIKENGKLFIDYDSGTTLDVLNYCFSPYKFNETDEYVLVPLSCPIPNVKPWTMALNSVAMLLSVLFLIPTIVVYLMIKELRGNLRGKLLICYLLAMTIGYGIIGLINVTETTISYTPCVLIGFTCYFFFMAAFLWLSVLCFDIWQNFKETNMELNCNKNTRRFIYYSMYAWGVALLCTWLCITAQLSDISEVYKPGIDGGLCFLNTEKWSAGIYFYGPNLIILIFNFVTFALLTMRIYRVRRDLAKMTNREKFFQENAVVILRLFLIMGISWLFDILSFCLRGYKIAEYIFFLSDLGNAIQGLLIFWLFVMKRNVLNLLKKRFSNNVEIVKPRRSASSSTTTTNVSKLQTSTSASAIQPLIVKPSEVTQT